MLHRISREKGLRGIQDFVCLVIYIYKTEKTEKNVREQDICDKEIKNKKELCYNASDQTNKITGDPSYETYYNRRTETS